MFKYTFTIILIAIITCILHGQVKSDTELKKFYFLCHSDSNSILLPQDFIGPKYYHYEEGAIVYFFAPDTSCVSILCGGCADLSCASTYTITDTLRNSNGWRSTFYFEKLNQLYSRKLRAKNRTYMYENVPIKRKTELDIVFDLIEKSK